MSLIIIDEAATKTSPREMECELTVKRTSAGLEAVRQLGRKPKMIDSKIESARKRLTSRVPKDMGRNLGMPIPSLYRWVPASAHA